MDIDKMSRNFFEEEQYESLEGKLLIASPHLEDPYFHHSIIYICEHDDAGAIGIIVNQKIGMVSYSDFMFAGNKNDLLPKNKKIPLMFGGPVNTDMLIALSIHTSDDNLLIKQKFMIHTDILSFFKQQNSKSKKNAEKFILAKGLAAWDSQQLEEEIASNDWLIMEADPQLIFSQKRGDKWAAVIKKMGIIDSLSLVHYSGNA